MKTTVNVPMRRLESLDALRGFDMIWIIGLEWALLHCVAPDAPAGAGSFTLDGCFPGYLDRL